MADPTSFVRSFDFSEYQSDNAAAPYPGAQDDAQFDAVAASISSIVTAIKDIRRSDGALKNAVVTPDSLSSSALNLIGMGGYTIKGAWLTGTSYVVGDLVTASAGLSSYVCGADHVSDDFDVDLAAGRWVLLASTSSAYITEAQSRTYAGEEIGSLALKLDGTNGPMTGDLTIQKSNPQIELNKSISGQFCILLGTMTGLPRWALMLGDATPSSGGNSGSEFAVWRYDNAGAFLGVPFRIKRDTGRAEFSVAPQSSADATAATHLTTLQQVEAILIGQVAAFASGTAGPGWLLADGKAESRTTYAKLFARIGATYGNGDGSTTFNKPDLRGRAIFGRDDMGGTAASRVTAAGSGVDGLTRGATGGNQLMQQHLHPVTDPGHDHLIFDQTGGIGGTSSGTRYGNITIASNTGGVKRTDSNTTGITVGNAGAGNSQNMPPAIVMDWYIFAGTV